MDHPAQNTQTILIVDDAKENTKILANLLSDQGRILFALSGAQALKIVEKEQPDLILLDVIMPEMNGYEVCSRLQADPATRNIPIIFVTSLSEEEDEEIGLKMGAIDYIIKPYKPAIVRARVTNILRLQEIASKLRNANEELTRLATTDSLTGASNRRHFLERAESEVKRTHRTGHPLSVIMADIDKFKSINDTYGHDIGDVALIETVRVLSSTLRETDMLGRLGGEEFAIYYPETDTEGALTITERLRQAISEIVLNTPKGPLSFTCSFGMHVIRDTADDIAEALKKADEALYQSKQNGRNRITVYDA